MSDKTFVDTNILIYAHDVDAKAKQETAKRVLHQLWSERTGVLSMQVLQEFYAHVTRKTPRPLSKESARLVVSTYTIWCVRHHICRDRERVSNRGRIADRILGCSHCGGGHQKRRHSAPFGGSERGTDRVRRACRKPLCSHSLEYCCLFC
jgi:predicted nucleic acid-binding protein